MNRAARRNSATTPHAANKLLDLKGGLVRRPFGASSENRVGPEYTRPLREFGNGSRGIAADAFLMRHFIVFLRPAPALRDKTGTWPLDRITVRQEQGPAGFDLGNLRFWFNGVPSRLRGGWSAPP